MLQGPALRWFGLVLIRLGLHLILGSPPVAHWLLELADIRDTAWAGSKRRFFCR